MKRKNNNIKRNKRKKNIFILLVLFIVVVGIAFVITFNKKETSKTIDTINTETETETETNEETDIKSEPKMEIDHFNGIPVINDNRGVPIICYHSIDKDPSKKGPITIPEEKFRQHLQTIKDSGYTTLTMVELNDYLFKDKPIPEKSVVITFDDGYIDNYTNVFPILKEFHMNATIFVISSDLDGVTCMTPNEVKEMSNYGIDIESHTFSHTKLSTLSYEDQLKELKVSKESIEKITEKPVISIAYPEGKFNEDTKKAILEAGYSMGFTTERGYADRSDNAAELNRICVDYTYEPENIQNILQNLSK